MHKQMFDILNMHKDDKLKIVKLLILNSIVELLVFFKHFN